MTAYDNHVLPFLRLKGEDRETNTEYLEQLAGADIREVCLESRTHPEFCRAGWWSDLRFIIGECKRLDLKIWLLDDAHFPTGYANGALAGEDVDPALNKTVLKHHTVTVVGPQPSTVIKLGNLMDPTERFVGAATFDAAGAPLDLELAVEQTEDGTPARLRFDAPVGVTTLELYVTSQKTGFRDEYINMVDADSCRMLINAVYEQSSRRVTTGMLNDVLAGATARVQPPSDKGRRLKIYYMTQAGIRPPHFVCFCNDAKLFHFSYQRYLENQLRSVFGLEGTPIVLPIRQKGEDDG